MSDLHITATDAGSQFDLDVKIRQALMDDLGFDGRTNFDAILVTGDVAYHGRADEFARARDWFEGIRTKTQSNPEALFVVPGNHDVNQTTVYEASSLWEIHQSIRGTRDPNERLASLMAKLKDPSLDFMASLKEYNSFAQHYGCESSSKTLAWLQFLSDDKTLEDGSSVRFHGLNSALLSDSRDEKANLLISAFQFAEFNHDPQYVNVIMCHHPHSWLIDGNTCNDYFRNQAQIILSGHEHETRCYCEGNSLRVFAGAIHPNRREARWEPCYHVIRLSIDTTCGRELIVSVETRVWLPHDQSFGKSAGSTGADFNEHRLTLKPWVTSLAPCTPAKLPAAGVPQPSVTEVKEKNFTEDAFIAARRKLIVHFFRLGTISRFEVAIRSGVWEDGDDAFDGQERWARVFERAAKLERFGNLWDAVAAEDKTLTGQPNPFKPEA